MISITETNKLTNIKKRISNIIDFSTIHGIPSIFRTERLITRLVWLSLTVISIIFCSYFTITSTLNYLGYEVTNIQSIYEQPMLFPTVSICSLSKLFNKTKLQDLLIDCSFNDDDSCLKNPNNYFELFEDPNLGKCYRFNSGKNMTGHKIALLKSTLPGVSYGFILKLNETVGLVVNIHNHSLIPYPNELSNNYNGNNLMISSGYSTELGINRILENKLPEPYNHCYEDLLLFPLDKTLINILTESNKTYNQQGCLKFCFNLFYINRKPCNCNVTMDNIWKVWPMCFRDFEKRNMTGCTIKFKKNFIRNDILGKCEHYCPLECEQFSYESSYSLAPITTPIVHNETSFYAFYRESKYSFVSQQPKTEPFELISNVGGVFGLFIGISFLSFVEILEILIEILCICFLDKK